jgi:hypothetical protein
MTFQAYCPECEKKVTAITMLDGDVLWQSLDSGADVEVMHTTEKGDHRWKLNNYEKENLRKKKAEGLI